jgi:hypothetical protein
MLNNLSKELAVLDPTSKLLRNRLLPIIVLFLLRRQVNVDTRAFARKDLGVQASLAQVDGRAVNLVE